MSRAFNPANLRARKEYSGGFYKPLSGFVPDRRTGASWREAMTGLRVEWNSDCIAAYDGADLRLEVYLTEELQT